MEFTIDPQLVLLAYIPRGAVGYTRSRSRAVSVSFGNSIDQQQLVAAAPLKTKLSRIPLIGYARARA